MPEIVPVIAEHLEVVGTSQVETASVRIRKRVIEQAGDVDVHVRHDEVRIERVPVNRVVEQPSPIRREGDVTIVPVYEEVLVKQLVLREELRITRHSKTEVRESEPVMLRREEIEITRTPIATDEGERGRAGLKPTRIFTISLPTKEVRMTITISGVFENAAEAKRRKHEAGSRRASTNSRSESRAVLRFAPARSTKIAAASSRSCSAWTTRTIHRATTLRPYDGATP